MKRPIEIHSLIDFSVYVIKSLDEAHDDFDRELARLVIEHNDVITMGKFIAKYTDYKGA